MYFLLMLVSASCLFPPYNTDFNHAVSQMMDDVGFMAHVCDSEVTVTFSDTMIDLLLYKMICPEIGIWQNHWSIPPAFKLDTF